jgi:hypothetical protein
MKTKTEEYHDITSRVRVLEDTVYNQQKCLKDKDLRIHHLEKILVGYKRCAGTLLFLAPIIILSIFILYSLTLVQPAFDNEPYDHIVWEHNPVGLCFTVYGLVTVVSLLSVMVYIIFEVLWKPKP